jgi:MFS family permease
MKFELPEWLGPQRPNRTRGFLVTKVILFICLIVAIIETLLYIPIYYKILEEKAKEAPVGEDANVWVVIFSTVLSVLFGLVVIAIGMIGVLKENPILIFIYATVLIFGVILSLITFHHQIIVIFSAISNTMVAAVSYFFAYLIRKYDRRGW